MKWDTCNIFLSLTAQAKSAKLYAERKKIGNRFVSHIIRQSLAFPRLYLFCKFVLIAGGIEGKAGEHCQYVVFSGCIGMFE